MKRNKVNWLVVCLSLLLLLILGAIVEGGPAYASVQQTFYVSPTGNDTSGNGSSGNPWKTIDKARSYIRANGLNQAMTGDIEVKLAAGDYYMDATVNFNVQDSGSGGNYIVYKSRDALGSARIIAGTKVSGWQLHSGSIYKAQVGVGLDFQTLYENEKRAYIARYPNLRQDPYHPGQHGDYLLSAFGDSAVTNSTFIGYDPNDFNPSSWTLTSNAKIVWWGQHGYRDWGMESRPIASIDTTNHKINWSASYFKPTDQGERFYLEGIYELLDSPGEFYYDAANGWLYYSPMDGNPNNQTILLPQIKTIAKLQGSAIGTHAHHIRFEGLTFTGTDFSLSHGAIDMIHTNHIELLNNHFKNLGGFAIRMMDDNDHNTVKGNWIKHTGVGGILIRNTLNRITYPNNKSEQHMVRNNKIHDYSEIFTTATTSAGIGLWSVSNSEVSYSEIYNTARYATSLRGHYSTERPVYDDGTHYAEGNHFKYLKIHDVGTDSGDMGAVHAAHVNPTSGTHINYWEQITIDRIYSAPHTQDQLPAGIFVDHPNSCQHQDFSNIKVTNVDALLFKHNVNSSQTFTNVNWTGTFNDSLIDTVHIGLESTFPSAYAASATPALSDEPAVHPNEIIVDDDGAGYAEFGPGTWVDSSIGHTYNGSARFHQGLDGSYAKYTPTIPTAGLYTVYIWLPDSTSTSIKSGKVQLYMNSGTDHVYYQVTQQQPLDRTGRWERLGTHYFTAGQNGYVKQLATVNFVVPGWGSYGNQLRPDAVKFVPVPQAPAGSTAYWKLNELTGTSAANASGGSHSGTLVNGATWGSGMSGSGLDLDGINDYMEVNDHNDLEIGTGDFSLSLWFKRNSSTTGNLRLLSKGAGADTDGGYTIFGSDNTLTAMIGDGSSARVGVGGSYAGVGVWHHLAVTMDRDGLMRMYVNGQSVGSSSISALNGMDISNTRKLNLGRNVTGSNLYWPGSMDEVRLYKRHLSSDEVLTLYQLR
jgi:hypothetical protein